MVEERKHGTARDGRRMKIAKFATQQIKGCTPVPDRPQFLPRSISRVLSHWIWNYESNVLNQTRTFMRLQSIGLLILACSSLGTATTIRKEIHIHAESAAVWDAVRDFDNVDKRLVPGFVVEVKAEDGARYVTFANGAKARELLVSVDDNLRRLVYAIPDGSFTTYSASLQVFPEGKHGCLLVWIVDLLPNSFESYIKTQMDSAAMIMKNTLEKASRK
jgi:hypothetical protein